MPKAPKGRTNKKSKLAFDCPWVGHTPDPSFLIRNSKAPVAMMRCMKCDCALMILMPPEPEQPIVVPPSDIVVAQ